MSTTAARTLRASTPEPETPPIGEWLSVAEVAARFHASAKTVRRWMREGSLPVRAVKFANEWRISADDIEHFLGEIER